VLAVTEGFQGVLDTNRGSYLRFGDLPGSRWLARPGHPGHDDNTRDPLAVFEEQPDEPGDPMIWPRWTGFGDSDEASESRRRAVLAELRRELVVHPTWSGKSEPYENCPSFVILGKGSDAAGRFRDNEGWAE